MGYIRRDILIDKKKINYKKLFLFFLVILGIAFFAAKYFYFEQIKKNENNTNSAIDSIVKNSNTSIFNIRELNMEELKDKIILLNVYNIKDFSYTFSIEIANKLEKMYKNKIVIIDIINDNIGFDKNMIINYIIKNNIERPVINVSQLELGIPIRPNENYFVLVNKNNLINNIIYYDDVNAENNLITAINTLLETTNKINDEQLSGIALEKNKTPESFIKSLNQVKYINKIADTDEGPFFIVSDAKGRKIYIMTIDGKIVKQLGNGHNGNDDGISVDATFCGPIGIAVKDNKTLYIADICNDSIREVDLKSLKVSTLIKNNEMLKDPIAVELINGELIISAAGENALLAYNFKDSELKRIEYDNQRGYIMKFLRHNNKLYFVNTKTNILYSFGHELKEEIDFNKINENSDVKVNTNNNFYLDETGIYFLDKFNNNVLKIKDGKVQVYSDNTNKLYDYPTDIIDVNGKLFILNENNKKIIQLDKNTKATKVTNIDFGYEYNKVKANYDEFLNVSNAKVTTINNKHSTIFLNLEHNYLLEEKAPQTLSLFKEDRENNSAILIKTYSKRNILDNQILELPELDDKSIYYLKGTFYYCNHDKRTPCLIKKYNKKIITSSTSGNNKIIVNFLY